jgi:hypothetical protein
MAWERRNGGEEMTNTKKATKRRKGQSSSKARLERKPEAVTMWAWKIKSQLFGTELHIGFCCEG